MKKRLAFLLIAALLLSCLSGAALALNVGEYYKDCPKCETGKLYIKIEGYITYHKFRAVCDTCRYPEELSTEYHNLNDATCQETVCPVCNYSYNNPTRHASADWKWDQTATTHLKVYSCCGTVYGGDKAVAHRWSDGKCGDCGYTCLHPGWSNGKCITCDTPCTHSWSDGVCSICHMACTNLPETATCTTAASCSVCGGSHKNPNNHDSDCTPQWTTTETTHKKVWSGCGTVVVAEEAHNWSSGECKDCGYVCTHVGGTQEWMNFSPKTHIQIWSCCGLPISGKAEAHSWSNGVCTVCNENCEHMEYAAGVCLNCGYHCSNAPEGATCTTAAQCSVCRTSHTNPNVHDDSCKLQCVSTSATTHKLAWSGCGKVEVAEEAHNWSNGQCKDCDYVCTHDWSDKNGVCTICKSTCAHDWADGVCKICKSTCAHDWADGVCKICKSTCAHDYDPATGVCCICKLACSHGKTAVDAAVAPTCTATGLTEGKHCTVCQKVIVKQQTVDPKGHEFETYVFNDDASCTADGTETAKCVRYGTGGCKETRTRTAVGTMKKHTEAVDAAVEPTCTETGLTEGKHCSVCNAVLLKQEIVPALGHDYSAKKTLADCTRDGYTTYTCTRCADSYVADRTEKLGHQYGEWTPNGDGTNSAACLREGSGFVKTAACETVEVYLIVDGEEQPQTYVLCPICGELNDGSRLELMEQAAAVAADGTLPKGKLMLRMGALKNGEKLVSLCFENDGQMLFLEGELQFSLPAELLEGYVLLLQGEKGEETELPFTVEDGTASFTLEFVKEGEEPDAASETVQVVGRFALIRLVPVE